MKEPKKVALASALTTHQGSLTEVTLVEPKGKTFVKYGEPFRLIRGADGGMEFAFNNQATMGFLTEMSGIDEVLLGDLPGSDYMKLRDAMVEMLNGVTGATGKVNPTIS